ncbi:penicillin-binding protein 2 [Aestuariirhabdus sp. Z084]|uniref:penicillin-binding protein 2 n=1 Tax=Aestuariirhabdus haliotis TaxID=2918751 RepID=UPI00201B3EB5|nr:penicillin-binding protein 2 [Aestuariirhabdus haliotis]MCL6416705.1 penicillin-binding protein 2 [Aestuariirhabdus haliotis]MCL6420706.1 penicillin-binding protein 2 [Aestuariirhabdus haliotis]
MAGPIAIKDTRGEARVFTSRLLLCLFVVLVLVSVLVVRMINLQVVQHAQLSTKSDENRIHLQSLPPTRGLIYDTNGKLLAENKPSYTLVLIKERIEDLDATLSSLGELLTINAEQVAKYRKLARQSRPFEAVPLKYRLQEDEIARISVNEHRLPGVEVQAQLVRYYPNGENFAHSVGYVGSINERELSRLDADAYSGTRTIGKIGIERFYESQLLGKAGFQEVETNARGRVLRVLNQRDPEPGSDITLYLDIALQQVAIDALGERRGAVVAVDTRTGGVLVMASTPSYDPNLFVTGIASKDYSLLRDNDDRPLYNRASLGEYPPASTIKPMVAIAGLDSGVTHTGFTIFDPGWYQLPGEERLYRNWKREGHGKVNLERAVMYSNDTYFYDLALKLGIDNMHEYLSAFGLGLRVGRDISEERPGLMPSREWKRGARGRPWYPGETLITGIGQGYMLATPLQLAASTSVIANRGKWIRPQLLKSADPSFELQVKPQLMDVELKNESSWDFAIEAMRKVVHHPRGTAHYRIGRDIKYQMAGKTGTAQLVGIKQDEEYDEEKVAERNRDHALFVGFAPVENPQIAVAVVIENGGSGSSAAAPVARKVIDAYLLPRLEAAIAKSGKSP